VIKSQGVNNMFSRISEFDATATVKRFIEVAKDNETVITRVVNIALPLICMHKSASKIVELSFSAYDFSNLVKNASNEKSFSDLIYAGHLLKITLLVSTVAFAIISPHVYVLASNTYQVTCHTYLFGKALKEHNFKEAALEFLNISYSLVQLGVYVSSTSELIVISLLFQAAKEIIKSKQEFSQGRYLECAANLLYAAVRVNAAMPEMQKIHRNYFGKEITQDDFHSLWTEMLEIQLKDEYKGELIDFDQLLTKHNFKNQLNDIKFNRRIKNVFFNNIVFNKSNFQEGYITSSYFKNVKFQDCDLYKMRFLNSYFDNTQFISCRAEKSDWNWSVLNRTNFIDTNLSAASFNDSDLSFTNFLFSRLSETTFFDTKVASSFIIKSELKDCLLFDAKEKFTIIISNLNEITKPIIGLTYLDFVQI
jgi:uncharacterized protein YjbI with pentapeptide repeats